MRVDPEVALARVIESESVSTRVPGALESALLAFLESRTSVQPAPAVPAVPIDRRLFLTLAESAEFSGLPVAFLRRLMASGKIKAIKTGSGWRVSRAELEKMAGTLSDAPTESLTEHQLRDLEVNRRRRQGLALPSDNPDPWPS
jgi:excisionase family DNA binding protein